MLLYFLTSPIKFVGIWGRPRGLKFFYKQAGTEHGGVEGVLSQEGPMQSSVTKLNAKITKGRKL